jgi:hypothetical protein
MLKLRVMMAAFLTLLLSTGEQLSGGVESYNSAVEFLRRLLEDVLHPAARLLVIIASTCYGLRLLISKKVSRRFPLLTILGLLVAIVGMLAGDDLLYLCGMVMIASPHTMKCVKEFNHEVSQLVHCFNLKRVALVAVRWVRIAVTALET